MIPYGRQWLDDDDIAEVVAALRSDYLTTGSRVAAFEEAFAQRVGAGEAVAVSSGTTALHLLAKGIGLGPGDRVITSAITFLASSNCAAYVGATPDFADIGESYPNLTPESLQRAWKADTRAVVAVDYAGKACDMKGIASMARERGAFVIEDASHALGTTFEEDSRLYSVGGHPWADATVFSFHPVKTITSGEGGMITTDDVELANHLRTLRHHGMVRDPGLWVGSEALSEGGWYYEMQELGFNYRLSDIHCALGLSQLRKLDSFVKRRREIVKRYNSAFTGLSWLKVPDESMTEHGQSSTAWHLYTVRMHFEDLGLDRVQVVHKLRSEGIGTQVLYIPVYWHPWYALRYGYRRGKCPAAEQFYKEALSLPLHAGLRDDEVDKVIDAVSGLALHR